MKRVVRPADYVIRSILAHEHQAEQGQMRSASDWQLMQLGGVSGRTLGLAEFGAQSAMIARRARAVGLHVMTVFLAPGQAPAVAATMPENLTSKADYLVLPRVQAAPLPDRRPIAAAEIVVLGPRHLSIA